MEIIVHETRRESGMAAAESAAAELCKAIAAQGHAHLILATGASQFAMLEHLITLDVDWTKVTGWHLDEYVGLPDTHPASFRKYLRERFVDKVAALQAFHFVNGSAPDPAAECRRLGELIGRVTIDVACVGIGENGHLAFNDPPADFDANDPFLVVELDDDCRRQQLGEGWFETLDDVPKQAISMSVPRIMKSRCIVCTVPDRRKARAVQNTVEGPVTNRVPASILQQHRDCRLYLDNEAASLLK